MIYLCIFAFIFLWVRSVCFRQVITHPFKTVYNIFVDCFKWVRYHKWNILKTGQLIAFIGLFGKGKTLSAVHYVVTKYNKYNNKTYYDGKRNKWVTQKVVIYSNVELNGVPYEKLHSLAQIVAASKSFKDIDEKNGTTTCILVLGDEFSVQLNSRSFKTNIDPLFLNTLLTCRHHHITLVYTAQRFNHVDALLRQVTSFVVTCSKTWRYMVHEQYDAFELENATDPTLIRPKRRYGWFIDNSAFNAYDTLACVDNLAKSCSEGDMLTEMEILANQCNNGVNMEAVTSPSHKYVRARKKAMK